MFLRGENVKMFSLQRNLFTWRKCFSRGEKNNFTGEKTFVTWRIFLYGENVYMEKKSFISGENVFSQRKCFFLCGENVFYVGRVFSSEKNKKKNITVENYFFLLISKYFDMTCLAYTFFEKRFNINYYWSVEVRYHL